MWFQVYSIDNTNKLYGCHCKNIIIHGCVSHNDVKINERTIYRLIWLIFLAISARFVRGSLKYNSKQRLLQRPVA